LNILTILLRLFSILVYTLRRGKGEEVKCGQYYLTSARQRKSKIWMVTKKMIDHFVAKVLSTAMSEEEPAAQLSRKTAPNAGNQSQQSSKKKKGQHFRNLTTSTRFLAILGMRFSRIKVSHKKASMASLLRETLCRDERRSVAKLWQKSKE
jgi:hypothetical protein